MASGPYQSNVFRFVISQYRQGLERHRWAVRRARSTAMLGAALPVYAVVYVCQLAVSKLRQSGLPGRLFGRESGAAILDFSNFGELSDPSDEENSAAVDLETRAVAEWCMAQTLIMIGACLDPLQIKILHAAEPVTKGLAASRITGVASDLETRSLVLVKGHTIVWNGLSAAQQVQLQTQIGQFTLARPRRSFWVEVLRMMIWLQQRYRSTFTAALPSGLIELPDAGLGLALASTVVAGRKKVIRPDLRASAKVITAGGNPLSVSAARSPIHLAAGDDDSNSSLYLDADAVTTGYIEHPLEKLLRWVDRLLLWIEKQYRAVRHWLSQ
ncbi:MAG: hypothetical protein WBB01_12535 [Phormidesmis sp.]